MIRWISCPNPTCQSKCDEMKDPKFVGVFYCEQCNVYLSRKGYMELDLKFRKWENFNPFDKIIIHDSCDELP